MDSIPIWIFDLRNSITGKLHAGLFEPWTRIGESQSPSTEDALARLRCLNYALTVDRGSA